MIVRIAVLAVLAAALASAAGAQKPDTAAVKRQILALDRTRAATIKRAGIAAVAGVAGAVQPGKSLMFPGFPIVRPGQTPSADFDARYAGAAIEFTAQHAIVSYDGLLACTLGTTRIRFARDTSRVPRNGRYVTCWGRGSMASPWALLVHAENGEEPGVPLPDAQLAGAPHSATRAGAKSDGDEALGVDRAFARVAADSGPRVAFAKFAAADAMLLGARATPRRGVEEIGAAFQGSTSTFSWAPIALGSAGTGGLAFTVGEAVVTTSGVAARTKYLTIWRREADGSWKYVIDLGSDRP